MGPKHTWCRLPADEFKVRKKYYLSKAKEKDPSLPALYDVDIVDCIATESKKLTHTASYFDCSMLPKIEVPGKDLKIPGYITFTIILHMENSGFGLFGATTDS